MFIFLYLHLAREAEHIRKAHIETVWINVVDKQGEEVFLVNKELNIYQHHYEILLEISRPHHVYNDKEHECYVIEVNLSDSRKEYYNEHRLIQVMQYYE